MKSSNIGGQAVMEGVMMRNADKYAVAVRKTDGEIVVKTEEYKGIVQNKKIRSLPIIRGVFSFIDSMVLGMSTLTYSASFFMDEEEEEKDEKKESVMMGLTIACSVVMAVAIFMILPYFLSQLFRKFTDSTTLITLLEGAVRLVIFFGYILLISRMKDIQRVFMYHGAEHKCINCIEHGMELNVENVLKSSRLHKRCGTSFLFIVMIVSIIFFLFIRIESPIWRVVFRLLLIPVIAGVSFEFIRLAGKSENKLVILLSKPGMMLQKLTTREPDNKMIEVAIASVEEVFDWREYQRRCIAAVKSRAKLKEMHSTDKKRKSRAEIAEEIKRREAERAQRANERAKYIMERERREAELEKLAQDAKEKRSSRREEMLKEQENDDTLDHLDHFFDDEDKGKEK